MIPQHYHSDNGSAFTSRKYAEYLAKFEQVTSFARVGTHNHTGTAECAIRTIMSIACTMMLHAAIHSPIAHAVFLFNHVPDSRTLSGTVPCMSGQDAAGWQEDPTWDSACYLGSFGAQSGNWLHLAQYHVVFDGWFATVASSEDQLPDFNSPEWARLFGDSHFQYLTEEDGAHLDQDYEPDSAACTATCH